MKTFCIFGSGGFAKEVYSLVLDCGYYASAFIDLKEGDDILGLPVKTIDFFNPDIHLAVLAIGSPKIRRKVVEENPKIKWTSLIHPTALISKLNVEIGEGAIICANVVITTEIKIGKYSQLNLATTIGHDCLIGDYFTTAPGVHISGNCNIADSVYFGTNSSSKEKISIVSNTTIGAAACVLKDINMAGTYVGTPALLINK